MKILIENSHSAVLRLRK